MIQSNHFEEIKNLLTHSLPALQSCLCKEKRGMKRPLLEIIASSAAETVYDIERFIRCTLFAVQE